MCLYMAVITHHVTNKTSQRRKEIDTRDSTYTSLTITDNGDSVMCASSMDVSAVLGGGGGGGVADAVISEETIGDGYVFFSE